MLLVNEMWICMNFAQYHGKGSRRWSHQPPTCVCGSQLPMSVAVRTSAPSTSVGAGQPSFTESVAWVAPAVQLQAAAPPAQRSAAQQAAVLSAEGRGATPGTPR